MHRIALVAVIAGLAMMALPGAALGRTLVVGDGGAGCRDARYATIQSAVDAARPGDEIPVCAGTYREGLVVNTDRLKIFSRTRHAAVVQAPQHRSGFNLGAPGTLVRGFTIAVDPTVPCDDHGGDGIYGMYGATIEDNRLRPGGCHQFQDGISNSLPITGRFWVVRNDISGVRGAAARLQHDGVANSNTIRDAGTGILVEGGTGLVQDNTIEQSGSGIYANGFEQGSFKLQVRGNRLRRNGSGIVIFGVNLGTDAPNSAFNVQVVGNGVQDSAGDGIVVESSAQTTIAGNRSLGSGRYDCFETVPSFRAAIWKDNIGVTDSPSNLCRAP
ncbi:MAG TPA: right-handed parallel beta-helix repeat-containing protein [Thermoleophilaceae bacterium]|nr:right-handed parallel beta-helix repeat-containing protein [Thermoleophilaceae bacterium]